MKEDSLFEIVSLGDVLKKVQVEKDKLSDTNQMLSRENIYRRDKLKEMEKGVQTLKEFNIKLVGKWG